MNISFLCEVLKRTAQNEPSGCGEPLSKFNRKHSSPNLSEKRCVTALLLVCHETALTPLLLHRKRIYQNLQPFPFPCLVCAMFVQKPTVFTVQTLFIAVKNKLCSALNSAGIRTV